MKSLNQITLLIEKHATGSVEAIGSTAAGKLISSDGTFASPGSDNFSFTLSNLTLDNVRKAFLNFDFGRDDITLSELNDIVTTFEMWSREPTFIAFFDPNEKTICFARAAKRGNHVYRKRAEERIDNTMAQLEDSDAVSFMVRREGGRHYTNSVFVTLTWDSTSFPNRVDAWGRDISAQWNLFKANIRHPSRLGDIWVYRVLEATQQGYPHPHAVIFFKNKKEVYRQYSKDGKRYKWRLRDKSIIDECWHSFTDVEAISSLKGVDAYLRKDLMKQLRMKTAQARMSLALNWFFKKRSFAVTEGFDLIKVCITKISPLLEQIQEKKKKGYVLLGFVKFSAYKGTDPPDELVVPINSALLKQLRSVISSPTETFENLCLRIVDGIRVETTEVNSATQLNLVEPNWEVGCK